MQYVPFASDVETPFYASLASHKINHDKLDDSARKVLGIYEIRPADAKEHSCRMQIHGNALTNDEPPAGAYRAEGTIKNVNTIEDYRNLDKMAILQQAGRTIWDAINDGSIYSCPSLLSSFLAISFADLKKYRFSYWFAYPALVMEPSWAPAQQPGNDAPLPYKTITSTESEALVDAVQTWRYSTDSRQHGFFLLKKNRRSKTKRASFEDLDNPDNPNPPPPSAIINPDLGFTWEVETLAKYESGFFEGEYSDDCFVAFADPSNYTAQSGTVAPGWMLRNLLTLVRQKWKRDRVQVLCYRETHSRREAARSIILDLEVSRQTRQQPKTDASRTSEGDKDPLALPKVVGWERNAQGKLAGRFADLTAYMDPTKLADQSVDLNLKLIKWRISPNLDLDKIKETKCLLLGAGTLGSYVSRNLMGWGVRKITFIDNAGVSYSNPVRQPLFNFNDCLNGGARKATRAAEALKEIYPGVDATGHVMSVPMAGHPVTNEIETRADFEKLRMLIKEHDAIFLLMDSRESRWLPTVMGKAEGKIVMNAALGFDTYVVMRHGIKPPPTTSDTSQPPPSDDTTTDPPTELGCYFCNDVVAPVDSMKDLTLDQQCTVTRPGIAAIASATLVEIFVSLLQHPHGAAAAAPTSSNQDRGSHPDTYKQQGWEFVKKALDEKGYVEELSGLKEVQRLAEEAAKQFELDTDDEDGFDEGEGELI